MEINGPMVCSECGAKLNADLICPNCDALNLYGVDAFEELKKIFRIRIKHDDESICTILRTAFSAATTDPNNLLSQAPTSEGKSYPIINVLKHFPQVRVWFLGGLSPTALAHDHGVLVNQLTGEPLDPILLPLYEKLDEAKGAEKRSIRREIKEIMKGAARRVDLDNTIIVFLDNPNQDTINRLRPILSHDVWEISYKFADRMGRGSPLQSDHVKVSGWPATIAAITKSKADKDTWDQMASRFTTISPTQNKIKYRAAVELVSTTRGLPQPILNKILDGGKLKWAEMCIEKIWEKLQVLKTEAREKSGEITPNIFWVPFRKHIGKNFPANVGRHMRDSYRFMTSLNIGAAINVFSRPTLSIEGYESIIVTRHDYERAVSEFFEGEREGTIFTGLPAHIIQFFKRIVLPLWPKSYVLISEKTTTMKADGQKTVRPEDAVQGIEMKQLVEKCMNTLEKSLSSDTIRKLYVRELELVGLMDSIPHPTDKRKKLHIVLSEDVNAGNSGESLIKGSSAIFSLDFLKDALDEVNKIADKKSQINIHDFDGKEITVEELHAKYFTEDPTKSYYIPHFQSAIYPIENTASKAETGVNMWDKVKIGDYPLNPNVETDGKISSENQEAEAEIELEEETPSGPNREDLPDQRGGSQDSP